MNCSHLENARGMFKAALENETAVHGPHRRDLN
jgi:hypothetical protein